MTVADLRRLLAGFDDDTELRVADEHDWIMADDGDHVDSCGIISVTVSDAEDNDGELTGYDHVTLLVSGPS